MGGGCHRGPVKSIINSCYVIGGLIFWRRSFLWRISVRCFSTRLRAHLLLVQAQVQFREHPAHEPTRQYGKRQRRHAAAHDRGSPIVACQVVKRQHEQKARAASMNQIMRHDVCPNEPRNTPPRKWGFYFNPCTMRGPRVSPASTTSVWPVVLEAVAMVRIPAAMSSGVLTALRMLPAALVCFTFS